MRSTKVGDVDAWVKDSDDVVGGVDGGVGGKGFPFASNASGWFDDVASCWGAVAARLAHALSMLPSRV